MEEVTLDAAGTPAVLHVDETDHLGKWIAKRGWYELDLLEDARERVTGPGTALDVGAHIGGHSVWFALAMGLDVTAFEPNPDTLKRLQVNIDANPSANITAVHAAVDRKAGRGTSVPGPAGNTGMATVEIGRAGDVPVIALDSLDVQDVRLIKIDVEGTAAAVLRGARRLIRRDRPVIYAEVDDPAELIAVLPRGYRAFGQYAFTPTWGFEYVPPRRWWGRS
jgi:FkbM family methyltransferase